MGRIWFLAMAFFSFVTVAVAAEEKGAKQPSAPAVPPASGSSSSELSRSGGVITPPVGVDPQMKQTPPPSGDSMPVVPPPRHAGRQPGNQTEIEAHPDRVSDPLPQPLPSVGQIRSRPGDAIDLVEIGYCVVPLGDIANLCNRRDIAIHGIH